MLRYVWFGQTQSYYIWVEETTFKFKFELEATRQLWNHEECVYFGLACEDAADWSGEAHISLGIGLAHLLF